MVILETVLEEINIELCYIRQSINSFANGNQMICKADD